MTPEQRIERARQAGIAIEEFLSPAFEVVRDEYYGRLAAISANEPWSASKISALANAMRIVGEVEGQIKALILDGEDAKAKKSRAERIEEMSPAKRRLLRIGAM